MDLEAYADIFPQLLWVVRDFSFNSEGESPKNYLENALHEKNGISDFIEKINRTKRLIKNLFQYRDCVALAKPCDDSSTLTELQNDQLNPEFVKQIQTLKKKAFAKIQPKMLQNTIVSGEILADMVEQYTNAFNMGSCPNIETACTDVFNKVCVRAQ